MPPDNLSLDLPENLELDRADVSQLQAFFLVADDIMDQSVTRRGQPCWYRQVCHPPSCRSCLGQAVRLTHGMQPGVSNIAINDSFMLEAAIYYLLKKHFRKEAYYVDLMELFLEVRSGRAEGREWPFWIDERPDDFPD